jgi:catechol 2,3-dioxygenase-like lactoylglutathione lyase family enzyme
MPKTGHSDDRKTAFLSVAPLIPTGCGLDEALAFYTAELGFTVLWRSDQMAGIARNEVCFNLVENRNREWAENASFSIGVSDLEELYKEYSFIAARVGPLEIKPWGRREFHMILPSGVCLQFYETN